METETIHIEGLGDVPVEEIRRLFGALMREWGNYKDVKRVETCVRNLHKPLAVCGGLVGAHQTHRERITQAAMDSAAWGIASAVDYGLDRISSICSRRRP